jgi:hypothetical protein
MIHSIEEPILKKQARLTGLLYFIFTCIGIFVFAYVQPNTMAGDPAAIAKKLPDHEFLFRIGSFVSIASHILFIFIVLLLYRMFRPVNEFLSKLMVVLVIVSIPVSFAAEALELTSLGIFKGEVFRSVQPDQASDLGFELIKISRCIGQLLTLLWGLWLFPLGLLVYRSGFIPRIFGILLIVNGAGYVINCLTFVLFPQQLATVSMLIFPTYFAGELPFTFWLLIKGIRSGQKD